MAKEKVFYLRPPWEILFREARLERLSPWSIDLTYILSTLIEEMIRVGIDFRAAGTAINTSSLIHLRKAELLLKPEEPRTAAEKDAAYIPPPLNLPFRLELTSTTINDLIEALEKALEEASKGAPRPRPPPLPPPPLEPISLDEYLVEIEERSSDLLERIRLMSRKGETLTFSLLAAGEDPLSWVRTFMMLLFLAQRGAIDLLQEEDEEDIRVIYLGGEG